MARKLKVYGFLGARPNDFEVPADRRHNVQVRCVVAAHSMAELLRITGFTRAMVPYIGETGNPDEVAVAMGRPGVVFFQDEFNHKHNEHVFIEHPTAGGWKL